MKRIPTAELLDTDAGTVDEIRASLADLWLINRAFGGVSTAERLIRRIAQERSMSRLSLLEVASGSGEVQKMVQKKLQASSIELAISLLDRSWSHLNSSARAVVGDALRLPFASESFDLVSSTLFVHHLMPEAVRGFVTEALRVCRTAVVINDVIRSPLHLALVYAGLPLFRSRITWHDAPASVRQAYTVEEIRELLAGTAAARIEVDQLYLFRMALIAWKS
ncbi:MAG: methyltransferase domain-containing protein [Acidobacteria bacterium]|nr:methyltransferase domain-containing protein [Acidobacteriota bacterium]